MAGAFLKIVSGTKQGLNVPLSESEPMVVGRREGGLILDDPMVSGVHFEVVAQGGGWVLRDLGSTNGTMVDGRLVREATLRPGSEITAGNTRLVLFLAGGATEERQREAGAEQEIAWLMDEELVELRAPADRTRSGGDVIGHDLRLPPGVNAVIEVVAGQDAGRVVRFTRGNAIIGRGMGDVALADGEVSRRHAVVEIFGRDMIFVRDLGSTNGTFHNGRRVRAARIQPGDTIGVGRTVLRLQVTR